MKTTFISCFYCWLFISLNCSAQLNESYIDGEFHNNPSWIGDTSNFEVINGQLHLKAPAVTAKSYISTASHVTTGALWQFRVQMDFNPSSSNLAKVYLMSDNPKLDSVLNGYFIEVGGTNDDISLFRQVGSKVDLMIDGRNGMLAASLNKVSVQVTRSYKGEWTLFCDTTNQSDFSLLGTAIDSSQQHSDFFGVQCIYTSTRSNKFYFDDFIITGKTSRDTISPRIKQYKVEDDSIVSIEYTEPLNATTIKNLANYTISPGIYLKQITIKDDIHAILHLSAPIPCNQKINIEVTGISDLAGNLILDTTLHLNYCRGNVFDVLITEFMADPDPPVYLPNMEYLELYNHGGVNLNLENWVLQIGNDRIVFPEITLPADSFLILCASKGCGLYKSHGQCLDALQANGLNNDGEYIGLKNNKGKLIHWVNYDNSFYDDQLKSSGGWSLELIDITQPCLGRDNWKASVDYRGGSPGKVNSVSGLVNSETVFKYKHVFLPDDSTIRIYFSKPIGTDNLNPATFSLDQNLGCPVKLIADTLHHLFVDVIYPEAFHPNVSYTLQVSEIWSCSGQKIQNISIPFAMPGQVIPNDIVINEILFDALPGSQEFLELYNNSNKFIISSDLKIAYRSVSGTYESTFNLGEYPFLIAPQSFVVVVKSLDGLQEQYHIPEICSITKSESFPSLNNVEGCVAIMSKSLKVLDEFCYSDKMHFPLLANKSGVSLERVNYGNPSSNPDNWHSASSTEGFSTPGAVNSQMLEIGDSEEEITIEHEIFSPDNDGYKDFETIFYKLLQPGFVANVIIFDASGRKVKVIANNQMLGIQGSFTWNGFDEKGKLSATGIYLIYTELHHSSGEVKQFRNTCILGGELKR